MALGGGKYEALCTYVMAQTKARGAIVIVFQGEHGSGFTVQADPTASVALPSILRELAESIEKDMRGLMESRKQN